MSVRAAAVAGMFYPEAPTLLATQVRAYLDRASRPATGAVPPKGLIVPHAGYIYSGGIAAAAYTRLASAAAAIRRVVLLGPAHRVPLQGLAVPSVDALATPLGNVLVDRDAVASALTLAQVCESDAAHELEHSLEVQLPFLQTVLRDFRVVPFAVGAATPAQVAEVLELLWGGPETLIVISSDLSHYHRYAEAREIDATTSSKVLALSPTLVSEQACGSVPINGFLTVARRQALRPELLDLRNSGDTAGDRSRVVGYGSFAFNEPAHERG
ncbi:MAG TPA: AmmeMemoRadiSam system protein B [Steroidobacteraceae bacterium]|nr:AmmeMemoRadiSam system protein B [Steroidobacteraceae bacterium]